MATITDAYKSISDLNFWLKIKSGDNFYLSDVPSIIPLRWKYFKKNWGFLKEDLKNIASSYNNPDFLNEQINNFTLFIENQRDVNPKINPFSDNLVFHRFYAIFDNIPIDQIELTNEEQKILEDRINYVSSFSKNDFLKIRQNIIKYRDVLADINNLSDIDYNKTYNRSSITAQNNASLVDLNEIMSLHESIKAVNFILCNLFSVDIALDPFALARANAQNNIEIGQYRSGFLVKMRYGENLQSLASRYLGDANKWIDIAIANGLKPPYIDEVGIKIPLLSNGSGNQINIAETDINGNLNIDRFYINQPVFLKSDIQVIPIQRNIINIRQIPVSGEIILELDGDPNLDLFQIADNAYIRVYKPNTINSSFYVLIPSSEPLDNERREEIPWFLAKSTEEEVQAKVDLFIDDNGELNFTPNGDLTLSYGLDNLIQAVKLKLITEQGSLRYHPDFGLVNVLGNKNDNIDDIRSIITESITSQVASDPRFDRVENIFVEYKYNNNTESGVGAIAISLSVRVAGSSRVIPISFTVKA